MNRICIAALMTVMICASGCGPTELYRFETTEKLLSAWDKDIQGPKADYIRILIKAGADVNAKDNDGRTPLLHAVRWSDESTEIVTLLIEAGADVNAKDNDGWTPLFVAAANPNTPEMITLFIEMGADVNAKNNNGETPLMNAHSSGNLEIIKLLKAAGARE